VDKDSKSQISRFFSQMEAKQLILFLLRLQKKFQLNLFLILKFIA
jgi:hypothetical protein